MSNTNSLFGGSKMMGVCYAPYHQAASVAKSSYTKEDINKDLQITAQYFDFIRTYTVQHAQKHLPELCSNNGLDLALGCWIFPGDTASTQTEIDTAFEHAVSYPDTVKVIVIGNEVDLASNGYSTTDVTNAITYAKSLKKKSKYAALANTPLTICMTGAGPMSSTWSPFLSDMEDYAFLTIYPWYGQKGNHESNPTKFPMTPGDIAGNMEWSYDNGMVQAVNAGLEVVIAEIGWPSSGDSNADTSWASEVANFKATCQWIKGTNTYSKSFITMWFEMFDEPWKTAEGAWGPHWGIYGPGKTPTIKTDSKGTTFSTCS